MRVLAILCSFALACGGAASPARDAAPPPDGPPLTLPACPEPAALYTYGAGDALVPLEPGGPLAIVIGFQGFQMSRVSLRTSAPLLAGRALETHVAVEGYAPLSNRASEVGSQPVPGGLGHQSGEIFLFFNDVPLAELAGKRAQIGLRAATETCFARAELEALLVDGTGG